MYTKIASFLLISAISPKRKAALAQKYDMSEEQVDTLSKLDPTHNAAYTDWLCRESKSGAIDPAVADTLKRFDSLKNSPNFTSSKNILDYTIGELTKLFTKKIRHQLQDLSKNEVEQKLKSEGLPGGRLIVNDGTWKMWKVSNPYYATVLGSGTHWCTTNIGTAEGYCNEAPLYPIHKNDKPFAQGYVGPSSIVFMDVNDRNFESLTADLKSLLSAAERIPEFKYMIRGALIKAKSITKKDSEFFKKVIIDTDDYVLLANFLKKVYWPEGWEMLLDANTKTLVETVLEGISKSNGFFESEYVEEVLKMDLSANLMLKFIPYMIKNDKIDLIFKNPNLSFNQLDSAVLDQILDWANRQIESASKAGDVMFLIKDTYGLGSEQYAKKVVIPFWKKFGKGGRWEKMESLLSRYCPEYAKKFEIEAPTLPELHIGDRIRIVFNGMKLYYQILDNFLSCSDLSNRAILNLVTGHPIDANYEDTEEDVDNFLRPLYGYEPGDGIWPTFRYNDILAVGRVLQALQKRGCEITKR